MSALDGLRVLDLSRLLPGGFCSLLLADFGADVVKVEDTGAGDYLRWTGDGAPFQGLNRGKRSIRLDLKHEDGKAVLLRLARDADILLESFRPGVLDRLGVGYERLRGENPALVYCAISGYGRSGPARERPGHDLNYIALAGLLGLTGDADGPPVQPAAQIADFGGGALMAAVGILIALHERERSGVGQQVDCSMFDGALSWLAMPAAIALAGGRVERRGEGALAGGAVCYRPYACAGGGYVTLAALEPKFWAAFCRGIEREDLLASAYERPGSEAHRELESIFASRTREEWVVFARERDCCLEPVLGLEEALDSELVRAREMVVQLPGAARVLGTPIKLDRTPADPARAPAPGLGEHTEEVLAEAGYGAEEIAALLGSGAVAGPEAAPPPASFLG